MKIRSIFAHFLACGVGVLARCIDVVYCTEEGVKVGVNDFIIKATAIALQVFSVAFD